MLTVPEDHYRLAVVRLAPVADAAELVQPLEGLLAALEEAHPSGLTFSGLTPAYDVLPVKDGDEDNLPRFLASSQISYPFGRNHDDPTHGVRFFNTPDDPADFSDLSLSWFDAADTPYPN